MKNKLCFKVFCGLSFNLLQWLNYNYSSGLKWSSCLPFAFVHSSKEWFQKARGKREDSWGRQRCLSNFRNCRKLPKYLQLNLNTNRKTWYTIILSGIRKWQWNYLLLIVSTINYFIDDKLCILQF